MVKYCLMDITVPLLDLSLTVKYFQGVSFCAMTLKIHKDSYSVKFWPKLPSMFLYDLVLWINLSVTANHFYFYSILLSSIDIKTSINIKKYSLGVMKYSLHVHLAHAPMSK